jgi:hypothetical protein
MPVLSEAMGSRPQILLEARGLGANALWQALRILTFAPSLISSPTM